MPKPSCAPTPLNSFPFVTLAIFPRGRGRMAQSVPQASHRPTPAVALPQPNCDEKESTAVPACFKAGRNAFVSISVPPTRGTLQTRTDCPMGDLRISRSDKMDEKERSRTMSLPSMTPTAPSVSFRTRPRRLCIPRPRRSHRAHRSALTHPRPCQPAAAPSRKNKAAIWACTDKTSYL